MKKESIHKSITYQNQIICSCILVTGSILACCIGMLKDNMNLFLVGVMLLLLNNVIFTLFHFAERFLVLLFHIMIFTFLVSKPFIGMLRGDDWWNTSSQAGENVWFAMRLVLFSLAALFVGLLISTIFLEKQKKVIQENHIKSHSEFKNYLQAIALVMFLITMIFYLIQEVEPLLLMNERNYLEYYTSFESELPSYFHTIASFMKYSLCLFLATLPSKSRAFVPLALFELSALPALLIGMRNPIMLNSLFIFAYYLLRDYLRDGKKWIGKIEKGIIAVGTPAVLVFMSVYSFIRLGKSVGGKNIFQYMVDFFYGQGVTFDVLEISYGYRKGIELMGPKNYTFGGIIDYFVHGTIGQKLWGTEALPSVNCEYNGLYSNNYSHNFSYLTLGKDYLEGKGRGSSYLIENYFDFGYVGLIIFSMVLGVILIGAVRWFGRKTLLSTIILVSLTTIFFIPRAEATGWLTFIVTLQFWACVGAVYLGAFICSKSRVLQKILIALRLCRQT